MRVKVSIADCRAGGEPKVFETEKGGVVARVSVAHNEQVKDQAGKLQNEARWFQVVGFGPAGKFLADHVHKGTQLAVSDAALHTKTYDGKDGVKRTVDELHVFNGKNGGTVKMLEATGELAETIGEREKQATAPQHNQ